MASFLSPLVREPTVEHELRNARTGDCLANRIETAFDSATRNQGLLGRDSFSSGSALVLAPCSSVHTWFMRFPIDVLFMTKAGLITKAKPSLGPWRMAMAWNTFAVIELPGGAVGDTKAGDVLEFVPKKSA